MNFFPVAALMGILRWFSGIPLIVFGIAIYLVTAFIWTYFVTRFLKYFVFNYKVYLPVLVIDIQLFASELYILPNVYFSWHPLAIISLWVALLFIGVLVSYWSYRLANGESKNQNPIQIIKSSRKVPKQPWYMGTILW